MFKLRAFIPKSSDLRFSQGYFRGNSSAINEKTAAVKFFKPDFLGNLSPGLLGMIVFKHALSRFSLERGVGKAKCLFATGLCWLSGLPSAGKRGYAIRT